MPGQRVAFMTALDPLIKWLMWQKLLATSRGASLRRKLGALPMVLAAGRLAPGVVKGCAPGAVALKGSTRVFIPSWDEGFDVARIVRLAAGRSRGDSIRGSATKPSATASSTTSAATRMACLRHQMLAVGMPVGAAAIEAAIRFSGAGDFRALRVGMWRDAVLAVIDTQRRVAGRPRSCRRHSSDGAAPRLRRIGYSSRCLRCRMTRYRG